MAGKGPMMNWRDLDWIAILFALLLILLLFMLVPAHSADDTYCRLYSREQMRHYIGTLSVEQLSDLNVDSMQYQLTRFWSACINADEPPRISLDSDGKWVANTWSTIQRTIPRPDGIAAASPSSLPSPASPASPASPVALAKPPKTLVATHKPHQVPSGGSPQPLCSSHHMQTVYSGAHWRCK